MGPGSRLANELQWAVKGFKADTDLLEADLKGSAADSRGKLDKKLRQLQDAPPAYGTQTAFGE